MQHQKREPIPLLCSYQAHELHEFHTFILIFFCPASISLFIISQRRESGLKAEMHEVSHAHKRYIPLLQSSPESTQQDTNTSQEILF
jgi:hypothetical protein